MNLITIDMVYNVASALLTVLAFALTLLGILAYRRSKEKSMAFITFAFFLFFLKGIWLSYRLFTSANWRAFWAPVLIMDTIILITFYISAFKR